MNTLKLWRVTVRKLHFVFPRIRSALTCLDETQRFFLPMREVENFAQESAQSGGFCASRRYNHRLDGEKIMYLHGTMKGEDGRQFCVKTLKLDPEKYDLGTVDRVEVYGTDIDDPGEDYCEFRVIDLQEKTIAVRREMGY